jgi:hypothetical protein
MRSIIRNMVILAVLLPLFACQTSDADRDINTENPVSIADFLGHWSFDVDNTGVGWLDVTQQENYIDAKLLWRGGSVTPVSNVFLTDDGVLYVARTSPRRRPVPGSDEPRVHMVTSWLEARVDGDRISGYMISPRNTGIGVDTSRFEGSRLPDVPPAPDLSALRYGEPVELFNGRDLTGWRLIEETRVNGFKVVDGVLYNDASQKPDGPRVSYGNLRTDNEYEDFNLKLEVNVPAGSNSGVYLRGMYEIQVVDSYGREPNDHNMGALYSRIFPLVAAEKPAGQWQTMDITLVKRHLTVILNGTKIIDNQPVHGPTGGAMISDVFAPGPIFLQGDHGPVSYRNMVLTPILN